MKKILYIFIFIAFFFKTEKLYSIYLELDIKPSFVNILSTENKEYFALGPSIGAVGNVGFNILSFIELSGGLFFDYQWVLSSGNSSVTNFTTSFTSGYSVGLEFKTLFDLHFWAKPYLKTGIGYDEINDMDFLFSAIIGSRKLKGIRYHVLLGIAFGKEIFRFFLEAGLLGKNNISNSKLVTDTVIPNNASSIQNVIGYTISGGFTFRFVL